MWSLGRPSLPNDGSRLPTCCLGRCGWQINARPKRGVRTTRTDLDLIRDHRRARCGSNHERLGACVGRLRAAEFLRWAGSVAIGSLVNGLVPSGTERHGNAFQVLAQLDILWSEAAIEIVGLG